MILVAVFVAVLVLWVVLSNGLLDFRNRPVGTDFISFYAASMLALEGVPAAAYDFARHHAAELAAVDAHALPYYSWHYPPIYFLVVWPLAALPYLAALAGWILVTAGAYAVVVGRTVPSGTATWLALACPGAFVVAIHGQNAFLVTALFGGALLAVERRPILAGILIGAISFKPQFGILLPLVLAAGGYWRVFAAAAMTVIALAALSAASFGIDSWLGFVHNAGLARELSLEQGLVGFAKMQSTFAAVRLLGGSVALAYVIHGVIALGAAVVAMWVWRRPVPFALRAAVVPPAALLATPFVLDYDLLLLAVSIAWLVRDGCARRFGDWEASLFLLVWLWPALARALGLLGLPLTPLVLAILLYVIVRRVRDSEAPSAGGAEAQAPA